MDEKRQASSSVSEICTSERPLLSPYSASFGSLLPQHWVHRFYIVNCCQSPYINLLEISWTLNLFLIRSFEFNFDVPRVRTRSKASVLQCFAGVYRARDAVPLLRRLRCVSCLFLGVDMFLIKNANYDKTYVAISDNDDKYFKRSSGF